MKTLLSLMLFPLLVVAQPNYLAHGDYVEVQFSVDMKNLNLAETENPSGTLEVLFTVEVFHKAHLFSQEYPERYIPKNLNSLSLVGSYQHTDLNREYQNRLNGLLAVNDVNRIREHSLTNWLNTVPRENKNLATARQIPEGFGPRFSL